VIGQTPLRLFRPDATPPTLLAPGDRVRFVPISAAAFARAGGVVVLLASRQTVGGYPRLAAVPSVDLGILAQLRPGGPVHFEESSLAGAHRLHLQREHHWTLARSGLSRLAV